MDGSITHQGPQGDLRQRLSDGTGGRLAEILADLVCGISDVIEKHRVTPQELREALRFTHDVGLSSDEKRHEFVLLSDVLGLTSLVERACAPRDGCATTPTLLGPFYRPDAPARRNGETLSLDGIGLEMAFDIRIVGPDGAPVSGAQFEVWHASPFGEFENQNPDRQPEFNLRGRFVSDSAGAVRFRTVRPGSYRVPDEGPVGRLMRDLALPTTRPAHVQVRITAPGFQTLSTHVFDRSDPNIGRDPLFCVAEDLLADFGDPAAPGGAVAQFTFRLAPSRTPAP